MRPRSAALSIRYLRGRTNAGRSFVAALLFAAAILCHCRPALALNPSAQITQYGHTVWRVGQDGLDAIPLSITQTADGYIWIGTASGLLRFNGVRFSPWTAQGDERLRGALITSLLGTPDGSLYVSTLQDVARIKDGRIHYYRNLLYHPGPFIEDANGSVWMGDSLNSTNANTLCKLGPESLTCLGTKDGFKCICGDVLTSDHAGSVWIGSGEGVCHWQSNKRPENYLLGGVNAISATKTGALWAGNRSQGKGHGLLTLAAGRWKNYVTPEVDGTKLPVGVLTSDRHDTVWIGTDSRGLYRLSAGRLDHFDTGDGLSGNNVEAIMEDHEGDVWAVTDRGVDMFRDLPILSYSTREGLPFSEPFSVSVQHNGTVWAGTSGGLVRFKNRKFSSVTRSNGLALYNLFNLFSDAQDHLWVASGQQLFIYKDGRFAPVTDHKDNQIGYTEGVVEDRDHHFWVSAQDPKTGRSFLLRVAGSRIVAKLELYVPAGGETPSAIVADPRGGLWVEESQHGIFYFVDGRFTRVDVGGYKGQIPMMSVDSDGALWVVTEREGVLRYKDGKTQSLTDKNGLPCNAGIAVVDDRVGSHWFYMSCGIVKISDQQLHEWWSDPTYRVSTTIFDILDGASPRLSGSSPVLAPDGRIWWDNQLALKVIDPRHLPHNPLAPPVYIERVVVDHEERSLTKATLLQHSPREIEIDYSALSYVMPERVRFRYRLTGYHNEWTDAGTRRQAFYNDLRPGRYTFRVIACNNDGVWNLVGANIAFTIPPAWYQTIWFRLLCVGFAALLVYLFYQSRLRRYTALLKARFDERIEERTRLARDLHVTLLQTIQGSKLVADNALEESTDNAGMRRALDLVSQWLERATMEGRAALDSLRNSTVETNELAAAFRQAAEDCRIGKNINVAHVVNGTSSNMHPIVRDEVYRIGYEAIRNACTHSGGRMVTVELTYDKDLTLCVRDDGRGVGEEIILHGKQGHFGLKGMRERADRIGAKLFLKTAPGHGTEVTLLVPGSVVFRVGRPSRLARIFSSSDTSKQQH